MQKRKAKSQRMWRLMITGIRNGRHKKREKTGKWLTGATVVCFIGIGVGLGNISERYGQAKEQEAKALAALAAEWETETHQDAALSETYGMRERMLAVYKEEAPQKLEKPPYEPAPDKLNLAYYYPEDAESEEIIHSYAGQVFQELMVMDLDWLADLYELSDISPQKMASRLGKGQKAVMGGYNPRDKAHKANNPSSWVIHDWKKIHVNFIDGDGRAIDGFSNVQDILSMASVYTYFNGMMDVDAFAEYSRQLWKDSHNYSLSMGDLYYCSGCLNKTEEELVREAEADELAANASISEASSDQASAAETVPAQKTAGYGTANAKKLPNKTDKTADSQIISGSQETSAGGNTAGGWEAISGSQETSAGGNTAIEWEASAGQEGDNGQETVAADGQMPDIQNFINNTQMPAENDLNTAMQETQTDHKMAASGNAKAAGSGKASKSKTAVNTADFPASASDSLHLSEPSEPVTEAQTDSASDALTEERKTARRITTQYDCPGHVDLYIRVKIIGLKEKKGLFSIAKKAENAAKVKLEEHAKATDMTEKEASETTDAKEKKASETTDAKEKEAVTEWEGWTEETIAYVNKISNQDWFDDYGLSISSISLSNPLSDQEINAYMNQLPPDTSVTRRNIIHFALSSVGRVPYYWGGKAAAPGYEGNNFGALVPSDNKGRILRGLDCSGWINWVYWSATGKRLAGESTSSLCLCGTKISRSELKPGDIIVRTGTGAHVVMFLSWNANGQMNVIHESSASVNNVSIKTMDAPWPYYRKLVE